MIVPRVFHIYNVSQVRNSILPCVSCVPSMLKKLFRRDSKVLPERLSCTITSSSTNALLSPSNPRRPTNMISPFRSLLATEIRHIPPSQLVILLRYWLSILPRPVPFFFSLPSLRYLFGLWPQPLFHDKKYPGEHYLQFLMRPPPQDKRPICARCDYWDSQLWQYLSIWIKDENRLVERLSIGTYAQCASSLILRAYAQGNNQREKSRPYETKSRIRSLA